MTVLRRFLGAVAVVAALWAIATWVSNGFTLQFGGLRVSSRGATRPLVIAALCAVAATVLGGTSVIRTPFAGLRPYFTPRLAAVLLAAASTATSFAWNSWTASGSDAYAYVSQADLWRAGTQHVSIPIADAVPWPRGIESFTPYGYRPALSGAAIVPVTAPGLSLAMAALGSLFGHCAQFWVAPLCGGLLVWATFLLGRRIGSESMALGAAWLMATSPVVLSMAKSTMSDVPAAACWAMAIAWLLKATEDERAAIGRAAVAGAFASLAILVRPNLAPVAAVLAAWSLWPPAAGTRVRVMRAAAFCAGVVPGVLAIAWFNTALYGSPLSSGYGDLANLFSWSHAPVNARRYLQWLVDTQTPVAATGLLVLALPLGRVWPTARARRGAVLLLLACTTVWLLYLPYTPFETWWFLRFLLPGWVAVAVGTAALVVGVFGATPGGPASGRSNPDWRARTAAGLALAVLGGIQVRQAVSLGVFPGNEGERRYATIAAFVAGATEPSAVVITGLHAGALRYYSGRLTLRYDLLDEAWLDRAVEWLRSRGRRAYLLLEDWEVADFERRFASRNALGRVTAAPILAYKAARIPGTVYLYDPLRPAGPTDQPVPVRDPRPRCAPPATAPGVAGPWR